MSKRKSIRQSRAFATVLILMLLFMMLILVITYLRTMRAYSLTHGQADGDAGQVLAQLETDIAITIGADGKVAPASTETAPLTAGDIHEPYDYPWTNAARFCNSCRLTYPKVQTSSVGMGDPMTDDAWLSPWTTDASGSWTQVSNLFGSFLVYANVNLAGTPKNPATHEYAPVDAPAGKPIPDGLPSSQQLAGGQSVSFQNLPSSDPRLVDTDGDGQGDALWFYPKNNMANGLRYVAAVRIVDLSGCLNLNTALGELGDPPGTPSGTPRKGEGPYEINAKTLSSTLSLLAAPGSNSKTYRSATATTDWDYWQKAGGQISADGQTSASATGGRYGGNGLAALPKLSDEAQLRDLSNKLANNSLSPAPKLFDAPSNGNTGHYGAMPSNTLRSQLTTLSGRMEQVAFPTFLSWHFAPQWPGDLNLYQCDAAGTKNPIGFTYPSGDRPFFFWGSAGAATSRIMTTLFGGPDDGTPNDDYPFPPGFSTLVPTTTDRPLQYQVQVGACLQDAMERDNRPTEAGNWMGWKPLPILTEFYAQAPYKITQINNETLAPTAPATKRVKYFNDTSGGNGAGTSGIGSPGYAFELANPYAIPIRLANIKFEFLRGDGTTLDGPTSNTLDAYVTAAPPAGMPKDAEGYWVLKPQEKIVFFLRDQNPAGASGGARDIAALIDPSAYKVDLAAAGAITTLPALTDGNVPGQTGNNEVLTFNLKVQTKDPGGGILNWRPYNHVSFGTFFSSWHGNYNWFEENHVAPALAGTTGSIAYQQLDVQTFGADEKLNLLQSLPPKCLGRPASTQSSGSFPSSTGLWAPQGPGGSPAGVDATQWNDWLIQRPKIYGGYTSAICKLGLTSKDKTFLRDGTRQDIKNDALFFNYVGIPTDATNYPGTFPELLSAPAGPWTSATADMPRDNANAQNNGYARRDGTPHAMDIGKIMMVGPLYAVNTAYRGGDPLVSNATWQNTIGDALNFYLTKDTQQLGLKGLCLRADKPFYDAATVSDVRLANKTLDQLYADLATATTANNTADIAALRAGIRGMTHGNMSWADMAQSLYTVDSVKYKGKVANGNISFRPGTLNINTASQAVLNCMSFPPSLSSTNAFAAGIIASRQAPLAATGAAAPRQGLARVSELQNQGAATFGLSGTTAAADLWNAVSWLPQQASCRSDVYCAYILVQGYRQDDFNLGPIDVRRALVIYSRDLSGKPAARLAEYTLPNH